MPIFFLTTIFAQLSKFRYKLILGCGFCLLGLGSISFGAYSLWQATKVQLCPVECPVLPESSSLSQIASSLNTPKTLKIDLAGALINPGVYEVSQGARLAEVVELAGGFDKTVDQSYLAEQINLAVLLVDGQKVFIPFEGYNQENQAKDNLISDQINDQNAATACISVNQASQKKLAELVGVGDVRSKSIVENRPYSSLIDLVEKKVLTDKILADNQQQLCL